MTVISVVAILGFIGFISCIFTLRKYRLKYELVEGKFRVRESYKKMKEEELKQAQEMRRNMNSESPPDMVDSRITPVQFNVFSPRDRSAPGWKNKQFIPKRSARKY